MNREREQLQQLVKQWNENRLDLFHLSQPTEDPGKESINNIDKRWNISLKKPEFQNLEVEGVMRFYFQDEGERVSTKCIRVSSTATTRAVIDALVDKFVPDLRMLSTPEYSLWEVHEGGEERRLEMEEKPLVVQLMWHKDDREGRFLLKKNGTRYIPLSALQLHDKEDGTISSIKHFSKKSKEQEKKKAKIVSVNAGREEKYSPPDIYQQIPSTTFTRTISNPEIVMKKRRERKLEAKLNQIGQLGGSLKIYGGQLDPSRTYVTLLVSSKDTTAHIIREALEKYNLLNQVHPNDLCLVESLCPPDERRQSMSDITSLSINKERILDLNECPLITMGMRGSGSREIFFYLRHRPSHYKQISSRSLEMMPRIEPKRGSATDPVFILLSHGSSQGQLLELNLGITEVGSDEALAQFSPQNIILEANGVRARHCVITFDEGVVTITPSSSDAHIEVNDRRIIQTAILNDRDVIRLGIDCFLRYLHSKASAQIDPFTPRSSISTNFEQIRLSVSSMGSTTQNAINEQIAAKNHHHNLYEMSHRLNNNIDDRIPQGPPMSFQVGDYRVWDFLNEVLSRGNEEAHPFRLAPSFALYLSLRFFHSHQKPYLVQFITRIATQLNQNANACENADELLFWLANSSELAFLVESDCELQPLVQDRKASLAACVEPLLHRVVEILSAQLVPLTSMFFDENISDEQATGGILGVLDGCVRCARGVRLNAALTIQVASHLLHTLNVTLFNTLINNKELQDLRLSLSLGERLNARLRQVMEWAERNGLELAAECHLHTIQQAAVFLASPKSNVEEMGAACDKLNSLQVKYLLEHYHLSENEPPIEDPVIQMVIGLAERHADSTQGQEKSLEESSTFPLPFLLPNEGYVAEQLHGAPEPLLAYVLRLQQKGFLHSAATLDPRSSWIVKQPTMNGHSIVQNGNATKSPANVPNGFQSQPQRNAFGESFESSLSGGPPALPQRNMDSVKKINLTRGPKGIGLSIVAAQGVGDPHIGIYVKKVVEGGPAALDGRLEAGDQLLSVNGMPLINITQEEAAARMGNAGVNLIFEVKKGAALGNGLAQWLCQTTPTTPSLNTATSFPPQPVLQANQQQNFAQMNKPQQPYVQRQPPQANRMVSTNPLELPRHQRSASVSDIYSNDPNQSISGRSICSTDFAPPTAAGGSTRLPSRYRPTVIQPGRSGGGAQSPSALRKTAPSPTNMQQVDMRQDNISSHNIPNYKSTQYQSVHSYQPSTSTYNDDPRPSVVPVFRAPSASLRLSPPLSQSSPRETGPRLFHKDTSNSPSNSGPTAAFSFDTKDNYANLPLHRSPQTDQMQQNQQRQQSSPQYPSGNEWIRSTVVRGLSPHANQSTHPIDPPLPTLKKEPAIVVRPLEPNMGNQQLVRTNPIELRTTTFGVTNAVPTPLVHAPPLNGRQHQTTLSDHFGAPIREKRGDIMQELDHLDSKIMTEADTRRYRELLDEMAAGKRGAVPIRKIPIRHETVIDDIDPSSAMQFHQRDASPKRMMHFTHDMEPMDSPGIVGSNEVYSDPRIRRLTEKQAQATTPKVDGSNLPFQDKMRLFAKQIGENTPKDRAKESSAQRQIERTS